MHVGAASECIAPGNVRVMRFKGWSAAAVEFYDGLEADNSKAYWQAHRALYDEHVRAPMEALLDELEPEFGEGRIFRPFRDVRFSADKSPYKTAIGATLSRGGYVQFSADGLGSGCGMYTMAADQLDRYRRAVLDDGTGEPIAKAVAALRREHIEVTAHDALKTAPRGYPKDHPRADLLRLKGLITWKQWPGGAWLARRSSMDRVVELLRQSAPLNDWLGEHVGESQLPVEPRR